MRKALRRPLATLAMVLSVACGRTEKPAARRAPATHVLPGQALLPDLRFGPPADGLLSDEQVDRFIRVRRAAKGRTDADTALALGIFPEEIAWTRGRVIEALVGLDQRRVREASSEVYARTIAQLKAAKSSVRETKDARVLEEQIAALERERASVRREETPPPALVKNMQRVAARRVELEAFAP